VTLAYWLLSGWIDVAMIVGWMALVIAVGLLAWRRSSE
jgi:MYXO-CTERM domain-containing protein